MVTGILRSVGLGLLVLGGMHPIFGAISSRGSCGTKGRWPYVGHKNIA